MGQSSGHRHHDERRRANVTFKPSNIAARMGRWSAQHRKKAVIGWLAFVVISMIAGTQVGMRMLTSTRGLTGESAVAQHPQRRRVRRHRR